MSRGEDRAASEIIGAVILFGFIVMAFTVYQGVVVPQQNKAIEFNHNEAVQDSIQDLRNAIRQTATTAAEESVSIKLGPTYPERVLAINPGAPAGVIITDDLGSIVLQNITATDSETDDYFGSSTTTLGRFDSKLVLYSPLYWQYQLAPDTVYENTVAYNQFPSGVNLSITDQAVIDDQKITLIALNGSVSEARQGAVSVDTKALSTASNVVTVRNKNGPINITFNTRLTAANWSDMLESENVSNGGHVQRVKDTGPNQVSIILEEGVRYELRLAKVGMGTGTSDEPAKYIVDVAGDSTSTLENGSRKLVVEVRDRFNNPVSDVTVNATISTAANPDDSTEEVTPSNDTTGPDGRVTFIYFAPEDVTKDREANITVAFDGDGTANETASFDVLVLNTGSDVLGGSSDPASQAGDASGLIQLQETFPLSATEPYDSVVFRVNNTANESVNITGLSLSYATQSDQSGTIEDGPNETIEIQIGTDARTISAIEGRAPVFFPDNPLVLPGNGTISDIELQLDDTYVLAKNKEALIIEITIYFEGGFSAKYSVHMFNA